MNKKRFKKSDFENWQIVKFSDSDYNRKKDVVGELGIIILYNDFLGLLVKEDSNNNYLYYFINDIQVVPI